ILRWLKVVLKRSKKTVFSGFFGEPILISSTTPLEAKVREREPMKNELILGWTQGIEEETDVPIYKL
ncbi:unnamed protein product, partial [marine sediment metagenome]